MALPCEICPRKEAVSTACVQVDHALRIIAEAVHEIEVYQMQYSDPELASSGTDKPSQELIESLPGRIVELQETEQELLIDESRADFITCGRLITCVKPELIKTAADLAMQKIISVMQSEPHE